MAKRSPWLGWSPTGLCALAESSLGHGKGGGSSAAPVGGIWPAPEMGGQLAAHHGSPLPRPWPGGLWGVTMAVLAPEAPPLMGLCYPDSSVFQAVYHPPKNR